MTLGDIIKTYRDEHNLSMDAFSEKSGISKAYISLLEKNRHPKTGKPIAPSIQCIRQAAVGMGMDFNKLFSVLDGNVSLNQEIVLDSKSENLIKMGFRIKERRESLNMSRIELAEKIGVTASAVANYENALSAPKTEVMYKIFDALKCDANYLYQDEMESSYPLKVSYKEYEHIEKYRYISEHSPEGAHMVNSVLDREYSIAEQLKKQKERMKELESSPATVIDIQTHLENNTRFIEYHHSASAGTGVFILGNETVDQLPIPDTPENRKVDYAIKVSGNSMEPDYNDGDIVLVSQKVELNHGDVGIFIINNKAYIKEYGETELISRNPEADNINIAEYDNIVCMGKVIGKYR